MGLRKIIRKGDISLKKKSRPVTEFNARLHILLNDMLDTLRRRTAWVWRRPRWGCCAGS